jgi:hypothetical protein
MSITKQSCKHEPALLSKQADISGLPMVDVEYGLNYIDHYYINPDKVTTFDDSAVEKAIRQFQLTFSLPVTGKLDAISIKTMRYTPRCGCPDFERLEVEAVKWGSKNLTYFFESYVTGLSQTDQETLAALALRHWAEVADLKFERVTSKSQARLIFSTGRGPADNFDGPSNTLAWAFLPQGNSYNGQLQMKFDLDETWIKNATDRGILYLNVACHEFGHMLGLDHSKAKTALMAPFYSIGITKPQSNDDIPRIRGLYGAATTPVPPTPVPPTGKHKIEITVDDLSNVLIDGRLPTSAFQL